MAKKLRVLDLDSMDSFQLDENNRLYWKGKAVRMEEKIRLQWSVNLSIVITALATLAYAVVEILKFMGYGNLS
jgi:hypothetical protein